MAETECAKMVALHKEIVAGALKEFPFPIKKAPAKKVVAKKAVKKAAKAIKKAAKKAAKKTGCVCPPKKKAPKKKAPKKDVMPAEQRDEVFKKLTSDDKDGKKEKNTPQLPKKAPAKKDAKKKAPAKKVVAKKAPAKKKTADDYADELYVLLQ